MIGNADCSQLGRLFVRFFGDRDPSMADYFAESLADAEIPMSAVQSFLICHADDALMELNELVRRFTAIFRGVTPNRIRRSRTGTLARLFSGSSEVLGGSVRKVVESGNAGVFIPKGSQRLAGG